MKHNLGKLYLLCSMACIPFTYLYAEDFNHTFKVDNSNPYTKEAIVLTLDLKQTNPNVVLLFNFDLIKSADYTYQRVDIEETNTHHAIGIRYTYLIYPLHSGNIAIRFLLKKKVTTDDSVAYSFSGDRDNIKGLVTKDYDIDLAPLTLHVKALPKETQLVGDFVLTHTLKKDTIQPYEALPFKVVLKGSGYPPVLKRLLPKDFNVTRFTEKPIIDTHSKTQGTFSTVTYPMALSHHKSFTIPKITLKAFNPKTEKAYTLSVPSQKIHIIPTDNNTLVDKVDNPPPLKVDWYWVQTGFSYFLIFAAGYLTAFVFKRQKKQRKITRHPLFDKIVQAKDEKALLQILIAQDARHFTTCINTLEGSLYGDGKINLNKIKKEAINLL